MQEWLVFVGVVLSDEVRTKLKFSSGSFEGLYGGQLRPTESIGGKGCADASVKGWGGHAEGWVAHRYWTAVEGGRSAWGEPRAVGLFTLEVSRSMRALHSCISRGIIKLSFTFCRKIADTLD